MLRKTLGTVKDFVFDFLTGFDEFVFLFYEIFSVCVNSRFPLLGSHVANAKPSDTWVISRVS